MDIMGERNMNTGKNIFNCRSVLQGLSHEIRTNMNAIVALTYLMNSNDKEGEGFGNQILNSCEEIISLFDNFLDSAILETGNSESKKRLCNINRLFDDLFAEFRHTLKKDSYKNLILITERNKEEDVAVQIDCDSLLRIIRNLFKNSLKNTVSGYIKTGYFIRENNLTCYISDSGQGYFKCNEFLHTDDLNKSLLKYNDTVTAINLILVRKLISVLRGKIWIQNNGISGSAIFFSIPVTIAESPDTIEKLHTNTTVSI